MKLACPAVTNIKLSGLVVLALILTACGSGSSSSTTSPSSTTTPTVSSLSSAVTQFQTTINAGTPHVVNSAPLTAFIKSLNPLDRLFDILGEKAYASTISGLGTIWDPESGSALLSGDLGIQNLYNGSSTISVKDYMGQSLDPNFINSNNASTTIFGRLKLATMVTCVLSHLVTSMDTDGLPAAGPLSLSMPTSTSDPVYTACGLPTMMAGMSFPSMTVSKVTSPNFTKSMTMNLGTSSVTVYLKLDIAGGVFNFMNVEDQSTGGSSGRNAVDRTIVLMSGLNTAGHVHTLFEYASIGYNGTRNGAASCFSSGRWTCSYEFHRGYIDQPTDTSLIISNDGVPGDATGGTGSPTEFVQYTAAGRPLELAACTASSCAEDLALSMGMIGQLAAISQTPITSTNGVDYNACVKVSTRSIDADNTLSCAHVTGTTVNSGSSTGVVESSRQFYSQTTSGIPNILSSGANTGLSFTGAADIYTTPTSQ